MAESKDVVILQLRIEETGPKKVPQQKKEVEALAGSIVGLSKANKALRDERNKLDTATEAGRKRISEINEALDKNNKIIKENSSNLEKQRLNVGNYTKSIKEALANSGELGAATVGLTDNFSKLMNPLTASIAGLGSLIALYAKSTTGARDFAFAQARVVNIMNQVVEAFGKLVGGEDGGGGQGPFSKLIDHAFNFIKLSTPLSLVFAKQIKGLEDTSKAAAEAAERLKELEISRAFAQGDFKNAEREAELQRRIRDDTTKTLGERIEAARKIDQIMVAGGQIVTTVIKAQIAAIKESTVNYENNREAQLKVAQLMSEIADTEEDIIGKTTENVMAVKALRKEYEDLHKAMSEEEREKRLLQYEEFLNKEHEIWLAAQEKRNEARAQSEAIAKRFDDRIAKETSDRNKKQADADKKLGDANLKNHEFWTEQKMNLAGGLASYFKEKTVAYKVLASGQAVVDTYRAAAAALAPPPVGAGPILGPVFAAIAIATGLASVAKINNVKFAQGGTAWHGDARFANGGRYFNIGGRSHSQGGTKFYGEDGSRFEAEKDEGLFIMKKSANKEYLSALNQKHGGNSWGTKTWYAAQGGQIETRAAASQSGTASSLARIETLLANQRPVVYVEDIRDGVGNAQEVEVRSQRI